MGVSCGRWYGIRHELLPKRDNPYDPPVLHSAAAEKLFPPGTVIAEIVEPLLDVISAPIVKATQASQENPFAQWGVWIMKSSAMVVTGELELGFAALGGHAFRALLARLPTNAQSAARNGGAQVSFSSLLCEFSSRQCARSHFPQLSATSRQSLASHCRDATTHLPRITRICR